MDLEIQVKSEFNGFFIDCLYQTFRESIEPSKIIESLISDTDEMLRVAGVVIETVDVYSSSNSTRSPSISEDNSEAIVEPIKTIQLTTPSNSKIARAMMFVKNNKITHNF